MKKLELIQQQKMTAYQKQALNDIFLRVIEWLEKYIEITYKNEFPDWENKKQIHGNNIKRTDIYQYPEKAESTLASQLHLFAAFLESDATPKFREELKQEFYKWISATEINVSNCPERLRHYLFGINEVFDKGREKIGKDIENRKREIEIDSPEYMEKFSQMFADIQAPMQEQREVAKSLEDKNPNEVKVRGFGGSNKQGRQIFDQIAKSVADSQGEFHFVEQKSQQSSNSEIIQDVKNNPQNWRLDEVPTETNYFGVVKKQEWLLIHRSAQLDEGKLNFKSNPIYRWENFNSQQRFEIKQAKNISSDYLTGEEIKWVVREIKDNPRDWRIEPIQGQTYLVHNSAQGNDSEIGTLIHNMQKFSETEWKEINGILERAKLIDEIKQNAKLERGLFVIDKKTDEVSENEDWFIHNSLKRQIDDKTGYLIYVPNSMVRAKGLTKEEQKTIGYKSEQNTQSISTTPKNGDKGIGKVGILTIIGVVSVLTISGMIVAKKRLNRKGK